MKKKYLLAIPVALALACGSGGISSSKSRSIELIVQANTTADVTYGVGSGVSQELGVDMPWSKKFGTNADLAVISIVAQSKGTGQIYCKIVVDDVVTYENVSEGQYAVVTCSWSG